ncbi:hypothetical protein J6Z39_09150 [bacterium]|nr:hypothetical protein [bacterium]MBP5435970.1 hypothetical protein [bacterium]
MADLRTALKELAEKLYVYENRTCVEIAQKTGKNRRTIETWKKKYGWEEKRAELLNSRRALPQKLMEHYNLIMDSIGKDLKEGKEVPASRYRLAAMLFEQIPKAEEVEKAAGAKTEKKEFPVKEMAQAFLAVLSGNQTKEENDENETPI